ncbi:MAG: response regulator [bacterium]|nr:response regulator [bacterium]
MAIVTVFSGNFCQSDEISKEVAFRLGYNLITEKTLIDSASKKFHANTEKLERAMYGTPSFLNNITHDKEKHVAYLQATIAELLKSDNVVFTGFAGLLMPNHISHVLKVYVIAKREYRIDNAVKRQGLSEKEAGKEVRKNDNDCVRWTHFLFGKASWDESLYDIVVPMHSTEFEKAVQIVTDNVNNEALVTTDESRRALEDFAIASELKVDLIKNDHIIEVEKNEDELNLFLMKYTMRFDHYKKELEDLVSSVPGINKIDVKYHHTVNLPSLTRNIDVEVPSKVLLVDDEVEYVHTLSERLKTRSLESSIVYDGEEALDVVNDEEPEVMLLDLKMPGIDGLEVLRKVKKTNPDIEVIIVTGHGSVKEKELATELGAFAYLEKPVDIEVLTNTMQEAYKRVNLRKKNQ